MQDATLPLRDAVDRALRGQLDWTVLVLHLSRLPPPEPRPHHQRIARAVLDDAASRVQGQLFSLLSGDLALLFPAVDGGVGLAATLATLFATDASDPDLLLSRWLLPDRLGEFVAFLDALPTIMSAPTHVEEDGGLTAVTNLFDDLDPRRIHDVLLRQTGALVTVAGKVRVLPVYREVRFSISALEARAAAYWNVATDPYLFRHLIAKLDIAMLTATTAAIEQDHPLLAGIRGGAVVLHINLSLNAILSPSFDILAEVAARTSTLIGVEIAMLEAFADTDAFSKARARLREAGFTLVLDEVTQHALLVTKPMAFGFDWLKLDWTREMLKSGTRLDNALINVDPAKIILDKADTEEAVRWGMARGIRRFQGRHTDAILAASRIASCHAAAACSLRKCIERESAATPAARVGCANLALLDTSVATTEQAA